MNILVVTSISIPALNRTIPDWQPLRLLGHDVRFVYPSIAYSFGTWTPDAVISMGVGAMDLTLRVVESFPNAKLFCYNWDVYEWVWTNPRPGEYNYIRYGTLLRRATEIWVPSKCTGKRTSQWYGLTNWEVVLSSAPYWESNDVHDGGYVYCALREIPDPQWGWFERACKELKIPYKMTRHEQSMDEYRKVLAGCRLMVSHCMELSTGGLSLLEGYYLGKPCLLSGSEWHGGRDYFGGRAAYFGDKYEYLVLALQSMYNSRRYTRTDRKEWVESVYSEKAMCLRILERLQCYIKE